jgi:uncharacterized protein YidB (DUF937 family)
MTFKTANQNAISFSDLAKNIGVDEDTLMQKLAEILNKRETLPDELIDRTSRDSATGDPYLGNDDAT